MNGYLDIHSHILPGVDDGSKDMDMTMQMIGQAYEEGVRYMVATPHFYPGHRNADFMEIERVFDEVSKVAKEKFPAMELLLGNEIYYKDEAVTLLEQKQIHTLNAGRYVLVEFNVGWEFQKIVMAVRKLTMKGYYPILAHVERYACLYKREDLVEQLIDMGAYIQINAETLLGGIFDGYKKYCMKLMSQGMVHFLGSDSHNTGSRQPVMEQAMKILRKKIEPEILDKVLISNPEHFLRNEYI